MNFKRFDMDHIEMITWSEICQSEKKAKGDTLYDYISIKLHRTQLSLQCRKVDLRVSWNRDGLQEEVVRQFVAVCLCYQTVHLK